MNGGIGRVEMLYGSNIFALIGGGESPKWPTSKVMIWDDHSQKSIGEMCFNGEVKDVKLRYDKYVFNLHGIELTFVNLDASWYFR